MRIVADTLTHERKPKPEKTPTTGSVITDTYQSVGNVSVKCQS